MIRTSKILPQEGAYRALKRGFDIVAASGGLLLTLPLMAAAGASIRREDGGPILFRQQRVGRAGRPFTILKLRTMAQHTGGSGLTADGDNRVTGVGRRLRRAKIDELPQLVNVLRGEMSLVGPRPELPRYVAHYTGAQREALRVRPGLTDPASLRFYNEGELLAGSPDPEGVYLSEILPKKLELSIFYQRYATPRSDLCLLVHTLVRSVIVS